MTEEQTTYKYQDLSEHAKERARLWYVEHGLSYNWWDDVYEMAKEDGMELGFDIAEIHFSGFWSQGDGARWKGAIDVIKWLEANAPDTIGVSALIALINTGYIPAYTKVSTTYSNYCHENTMDVAELTDVDERLIDGDELDEAELIEIIDGQGIFDGMSVANVRDIINTDEANPHRLSNIHRLNQDIEESAKDYARHIYRRLQEEYEYLISEQQVAEHFEINDFTFDEEGKPV